MDKPPYKVPSMVDIAKIPHNGYNAISTFSGCGGSSLGYKMAGFKVLWANEFIPSAQDTYRANHHGTILDTRDIRQVTAQDILTAINLKKGELDLFDGSPPCASFSTSGKREKGWGDVKQYSDTKQRTDDLFFEYARLLNDLQPKVFVAENVSGLVKGTAKGYFLEILKALKESGYEVSAKLLDASYLGVPQARQRVIFVGVRNDLGIKPVHPTPLKYRYSVRDAWVNVGDDHEEWFKDTQLYKYWLECDAMGNHAKRINLKRIIWDRPSGTVCQTAGKGGTAALTHPDLPRYPTIAELKRISSFPDDFVLTGDYSKQWERIGRSVPPVMMYHIAKTIQEQILCKIK